MNRLTEPEFFHAWAMRWLIAFAALYEACRILFLHDHSPTFEVTFTMRLAFGWLQEHWSDVATMALVLIGVIFAMFPAKVAELEDHPRWGGLWKFGLSILLVIIGVTGLFQGIHRASRADAATESARAEQSQNANNNREALKFLEGKLDKVLSNPHASTQQKQNAAALKQEITDVKTRQDKNLAIRNKLAHFLEGYNVLDKNVCTPRTVGPAGSGAGITPEKCQELYRNQTAETRQYICDSGEMEYADCVEFGETSVPTGYADALKRLIERYRK